MNGRTMIRAVSFAVAVLQGCATLEGKPLKSAWYLQTGDDHDRAEIELVLVNRSPRTVRVEQVFLNPNVEDKAMTWTREGSLVLEPGKLAILRTSEFTRSTAASKQAADERGRTFTDLCLIPVSLSVALSEATRAPLERLYGWAIRDAEGRIEVELAGQMPSSLPEGRLRRCPKTP